MSRRNHGLHAAALGVTIAASVWLAVASSRGAEAQGPAAAGARGALGKGAVAAARVADAGTNGADAGGLSVEEASRRANRIARAKAQRQALREKIAPLLRGRPMDDALGIELDVHARRVARLARIAEVARAAGDARSETRAKELLAKETARHDAWLAAFAARAEGAK